jgi:anti-sigma factor (TIGR02949 family)
MSCGDHHKTDCTEVLNALFLYLDHEIDDEQRVNAISVHLEECPPCKDHYSAEDRLKILVARCCQDPAPDLLRSRIVDQLTEIRIQMTRGEVPGG